MLDDPNSPPGWLPGAPAPWLDAYGPPPDQLEQLASTLGPRGTESTIDPVPPPPPPPPPEPVGAGAGRKGGSPTSSSRTSRIGEGGPQAQEEIANTPAAPAQPSAESGAGSPPPWLVDLQQHAQVAGGPQPFTPPWMQQPTADAVSGGQPAAAPSETPDQSLARIAVDPSAPLQSRQNAWRDMDPKTRTQLVNSADPHQLAAIATADMDPADLAAIAVRHQQAQIHEQSSQQLELARKRDEQARLDYVAYQGAVQQANTATQQLMADAQNLAQQKIDPNEHGVGHFIASVLTSAVGGAMSQYTGGRNLALEELNKTSERRIAAQQANLTNGLQTLGFKRNLIAEQLQQSGDLYHASAAYHISQYDRALGDLQTRMQDYDPQGTTSLRMAGAYQQVSAQRAQALQTYNQQVFKNNLDAAKVKNELNTQQETVRHNKASEGLDWAKYGLEQQKATKLSPEDQKRQDELAARQIGGVVYGAGPDGTVQRGVLTVDGKPTSAPFVPNSPEDAKSLKEQAPHVNEVNRLANQMVHDIAQMSALDKAGKLGTAGHQKLLADKEALIFALHGAEKIEGFRPGTAEMLEKLLGGVDPDAWLKDATPGIVRARDNINDMYTAQLHAAGWQGQRYAPPDTSSTEKPVDSVDQARVRKLEGGAASKYNEAAAASDLTPESERELTNLENQTTDPDPTVSKRAFDDLEQVANSAKSLAARQAAREILARRAQEAGTSGIDAALSGENPGPASAAVAPDVPEDNAYLIQQARRGGK